MPSRFSCLRYPGFACVGPVLLMPLPLLMLNLVCPSLGLLSAVSSILNQCSVLSSLSGRASDNAYLCASSLATSVNNLDGDVFKRRRYLTAIPGLPLIQRSARFLFKTVQFQLQKLLRLNKNNLIFKIVLWLDINNNSITPHSSKFQKLFIPQELVKQMRALSCSDSATVYCH